MIDTKIDHSGIERKLGRLMKALVYRVPVMQAIAGIMAGGVEENFARQGRPQWQGLKPETLQQRVGSQMAPGRGILKGGAWSIKIGQRVSAGVKILQRSGRLAGSMTEFSSNDNAGVGTNVVYAAIQNFGGETKPHVIQPRNKKALAWGGGRPVGKVNHPGSKVPARQFLVLCDQETDEIEQTVEDYLRRAAG
ncbi:phage virion morphogenesis protein [Neisseriaceae bacterium JH1-16]|nr:phage virion morphogenesis protein [Neisseriaceae bacterium JH1-16]